MTHPIGNPIGKAFVLSTLAGLALMSTAVQAEDSIGSHEYRNSCATCHGANGQGDGPMAQWLTKAPADLTQLSASNNGEFPFEKVFQMIDGRNPNMAHGDREMPIWGSRFSQEYAGTGGGLDAESVVYGRILSVVYHIQTLQQK